MAAVWPFEPLSSPFPAETFTMDDVLPHDHRRPMRRADRAMSPEDALDFIRRTPNAVMGTADAEGRPYGVPVTVAFVDGLFYVHGTSAGGRRSSNLTENPFASLTFVAEGSWDPEDYSLFYASVIVDGTARLVTDRAEDEGSPGTRERLWRAPVGRTQDGLRRRLHGCGGTLGDCARADFGEAPRARARVSGGQ